MAPETSEQAQANVLAQAIMLMVDNAATLRRKYEELQRDVKAMSLENERLRAKCQQYEVADLERRRYQEEG